MSRELQTLALADRNQAFLDAEAKIDQAIQIRQGQKVSTWRTMIPRGTFTLQEGLEKKAYRFFPGLGQQRGLHLWDPVQISRKASDGDAGFDAAQYNPHTVTYGFDSVTYGGLQVAYNTPTISIRDLRFMWQIRQQLAAVYGFLGDFTNDLWENYSREQYAKKCNDASSIYALSDGPPTSVTCTYDPESTDTDGDNTLTVTSAVTNGTEIGILNWNYLKWFSRYLQMQVPNGAIGNKDGRPVFGLVLDLEDFDRMVEEDDRLREDWRHAQSDLLIKNYGMTTHYKGFTLMHDMMSPRFAIKSAGSANLILKRIDPKTSAATLTGQRADVNEDYLNAEFGTAFVFLKDVYQTEIPPAGPSSPGAGVNFGATPGLNGEWKWLNIQDAETNPLNEIGFWFMRAEAFAKPLTNREEPVMIIYRRFAHIRATDTDIGGTDAASSQGVAVDAVAGDLDSDNQTIWLRLDGFLTAEAGQTILLTDDDGTTDVGVVADSSQAPLYLIACETATSAFGKYTAAGTSNVTVT